MQIKRPSPGAVGPVSRLWRRYADTPAATQLTGLRLAVDPASRPLVGAMLTLLRLPFFVSERGFAPGVSKGAVPEAPPPDQVRGCAPATQILARTTPHSRRRAEVQRG